MAVPSDHDIILALGEDLHIGIWVARAPTGEEVYANRTFATIMGTGVLQASVGNYSEPYGILTRDRKPYPEERLPFVRALVEKKVVVNDDITIRRPDGTCIDVRRVGNPGVGADGTGLPLERLIDGDIIPANLLTIFAGEILPEVFTNGRLFWIRLHNRRNGRLSLLSSRGHH